MTTNDVEMGKVIAGLMLVAGLWVGVEFFTYGPSRAFDGAFASFPRKGPPSPGGGLVVRTPSIGGVENAACFAYPLRPPML